MAEQLPIAEFQRDLMAAKQAHANALKSFARNIDRAISSLGKSAKVLDGKVEKFGDIPVIRALEDTLKESESSSARSVGTAIKFTRSVADAALSLQAQFNRLRKELMISSAASGRMGEELDAYVKTGITEAANLRQGLHTTQKEWDDYLKVYRSYGATLDMMNTRIIDNAATMSKSVTQNLFEVSKRFDLDTGKVTAAVVSTLTMGGPMAEDTVNGTKDVLNSWRAVAYGAKDAGSSVVKAFDLISTIASGTEMEVSSGSRRILGLADMYGQLFKLLKNNQKQGLIEEYFKAIESGIREMSISSAALFSGVGGQSGNALTDALDMQTKIRTLKDRAGNDVSPMEIVNEVTEGILRTTQTTKIITEEEFRKASGAAKQRLTTDYLAQDAMFKEAYPSLNRGQIWTLRGILGQVDKSSAEGQKKLKEAVELMGQQEGDEAKKIEDQKMTSLGELGDITGAWLDKLLFGAKDDHAVKIKNANTLFVVQHGAKSDYVSQQLGGKKLDPETLAAKIKELEADYESKKRDFVIKSALYTKGSSAAKLNPEMIKVLREKGEKISESVAEKIAGGESRYAKLKDDAVPISEKAEIMKGAIQEAIDKEINSASTEVEKQSLREAYASAEAKALMNVYQKTEVISKGGLADKAKDKLGIQSEPKIQISTAEKDVADIKGRVLSIERALASRKAEEAKKDTGVTAVQEAHSGLINTTEGEIRKMKEGEMVIPKNQSDIIRREGGTMAFVDKLNAPQSPVPKLLELPSSVSKSVGGQMNDEQLMAFKFNIAYNESRNNYGAMNDQTSASGKYQFLIATARGLWKQNKESFKDLGINESDFSDVSSYRRMMTDQTKGPAMQERLMNTAITDYTRYLKRADMPINQETLAAVHFMGPKAISMMKRYGQGFLSSDFNPTAGTGIRNASIGGYVNKLRAMGVEAFRKSRLEGTLLGGQSSDFMKGLSATAGKSKGVVASVGKVAAGLARKTFDMSGLTEFASSLLPGILSSQTARPSAGQDEVASTTQHSVVVPFTMSSGDPLGATCTINFETTTITKVS